MLLDSHDETSDRLLSLACLGVHSTDGSALRVERVYSYHVCNRPFIWQSRRGETSVVFKGLVGHRVWTPRRANEGWFACGPCSKGGWKRMINTACMITAVDDGWRAHVCLAGLNQRHCLAAARAARTPSAALQCEPVTCHLRGPPHRLQKLTSV